MALGLDQHSDRNETAFLLCACRGLQLACGRLDILPVCRSKQCVYQIKTATVGRNLDI
jgi:hypothetical protein